MNLIEKLISHRRECEIKAKLVEAEVEVDQSYAKTKQETVFVVSDKRLSKQTDWNDLYLN